MFLIALALVAADPVVEPWDLTSRVSVLEKEVAELKRKVALCPCITNAEAAHSVVQSTPVVQQAAPVVQYQQPQVVYYSAPQQYAAPMYYSEGGGSCANGQCGTSASGRRGLFRRR